MTPFDYERVTLKEAIEALQRIQKRYPDHDKDIFVAVGILAELKFKSAGLKLHDENEDKFTRHDYFYQVFSGNKT